MKLVYVLLAVGLVALSEGFPNIVVRQLPPLTTTRPAATTTKAAATTAKPAVTTAQPAVTTVKPAITTAQPAVTTAKPAITTAQPAVTTAKPAITTTQPAVTTAKPAVTTAQAATTTAKAAVTTTVSTTKNAAATTTKSSVTNATTTVSATTTASSTTYNTYQTYLINKAKALVAAGTCTTTQTSNCVNNCTTSATSLYYSWTDASYRYIVVSGIPSHTFGSGAVKANPNSACENIKYFKLPLNPVKSSTSTSTSMGAVGAAVTGTYFYNTLSTAAGALAVPNEGTTLDSCTGHSDPSCTYHYHSEPVCVSNYNGGCVLLGYWIDGFPIYSYCPSPADSSRKMTSCYSLTSGKTGLTNTDYTYSKTTSCDLDVNNGYTSSNGTYAYYMTSSYPWVPVGYSGTVSGKVCNM